MQSTDVEHTALTEFARSSGSVRCEGNSPINLDSEECCWLVESGTVDLFIFETKEGVEHAPPQHLMHLSPGRLIPAVRSDVGADDVSDTRLSILAKGTPGTLLKKLDVADLTNISSKEIGEQVDLWLTEFTEALARFVYRFPQFLKYIDPNSTQELEPCNFGIRRGVAWAVGPSQGMGLFMDLIDSTEAADESSNCILPLTRSTWLAVLENVTVSSKSTQVLVEEERWWDALNSFHKVAFQLERLNRRLAVVDDANLERDRSMSRRLAETVARTKLFNVYDHPLGSDVQVDDTVLADALTIIGRYQGIEFSVPKKTGTMETTVSLSDIVDASSIRARKVRLDPDSKWWRSDSTAMLAFRSSDEQPVVLVPGLFGRYKQIDPVSGQSQPVSRERAEELKDEAWMFYCGLPPGPLEPSDLSQVALNGSGSELIQLVIGGFISGLLKLVPAFALGFVANHISGNGSTDALYVVAFTLAGFALLGAIFHFWQNTVMMRFEGRSASRLEAAFWDRLMRLPSAVLNRHPSGDLAMSGMTFQNLRDGLQGVGAYSLLSVVFLLPVFAVIFFYDAVLGTTALVFSLIALATTLYLGMCQIAPNARMIGAVRRVAGLLFEIIGGITQLRVENAEGSAFARWAYDYREQKQAEYRLGQFEGHARALGAALPYIATGVLLFVVAARGEQVLPVGDFLVVFSVFILFQHAIARFGQTFGAVATMLPAMDQMRPLLSAEIETSGEGEPVDSLRGEILFDRVSFRYDEDGPLILNDVTIRARPGEFIAIAGESGAGKSTLFKLALGLDRPTGGAVYFDGRDLRHLNLKQLRRRIGAVPQSVRLVPQDLWDNIVAHHDEPSTEQVWESARSANMEKEIKAMPMGLMTMVGSSGSVLSGGEGQRIAIARSLLGNPRVMLFDEATNWLDNESQSEVMKNLARLTTTRLVIAHRLSTLEQADRIYVMESGKVVQVGSFDELMEVEGVFKELVRRQIA